MKKPTRNFCSFLANFVYHYVFALKHISKGRFLVIYKNFSDVRKYWGLFFAKKTESQNFWLLKRFSSIWLYYILFYGRITIGNSIFRFFHFLICNIITSQKHKKAKFSEIQVKVCKNFQNLATPQIFAYHSDATTPLF